MGSMQRIETEAQHRSNLHPTHFAGRREGSSRKQACRGVLESFLERGQGRRKLVGRDRGTEEQERHDTPGFDESASTP